MALGHARLSQGCWVQGVSAWNFDVAALKEQAAREGPDPPMPTISEAPASESGPQSHPLKLPANGPSEAGQGKRMPILNARNSCRKQATSLESMGSSIASGVVKSACD